MIRNDFAVFILSHGRANNIKTLDTIQRCGYTGRYYIILDDEDSTIQEYINNFGKDHIIIFNKQHYVDTIDEMDNFYNHYACVYARNACFDIAKDLGLTYFLELDDDYREIWYRFPNGKKLGCKIPRCLDDIFEAYLDFLDDTNATSVAMCQGGDLIGGVTNKFISDKLKRKTMNSWFCKVTDRINFIGTMNDDVNTYLINRTIWKVIFNSISNADKSTSYARRFWGNGRHL